LCYGVLVAARTSGSTTAAELALREEIAQADPTLSLLEVGTFYEAQLSGFYRQEMLLPGRLALIGMVVAMLLALIGLAGIVGENVGRRSREIGVRVALGARPADVLAVVSRESVRTAMAGCIAGILGVLLLHRTFSTAVFGYMALRLGAETVTLSAFAAVLPLLAVIGVVTVMTARRVLGVDPIEAIRAD
jgi:ABC-type lipoprotein release transport system permease subunit